MFFYNWRCPKIVVPLVIIHLNTIFQYKPSIWGYPIYPKWIIYNGKSHWNGMIWGIPHLSGVGKCPNSWGFCFHHLQPYLLDMKYPLLLVGWCETLGHLPTTVVDELSLIWFDSFLAGNGKIWYVVLSWWVYGVSPKSKPGLGKCPNYWEYNEYDWENRYYWEYNELCFTQVLGISFFQQIWLNPTALQGQKGYASPAAKELSGGHKRTWVVGPRHFQRFGRSKNGDFMEFNGIVMGFYGISWWFYGN